MGAVGEEIFEYLAEDASELQEGLRGCLGEHLERGQREGRRGRGGDERGWSIKWRRVEVR